MGTISFLSVIRFSMQLMIGETAFLTDRPKRNLFPMRLIGTLTIYFLCASIWYLLLNQFFRVGVLAQVVYYFGLFVMTLAGIRFCFDLIPMELIFVGTGGYATEHIAFALGRIIQYVTGWNEEVLGVTLHTILFRFLIYPIVAGVIFFLLIRKNRGKGDFKSKDSRMVHLALIMLMAAIILSVFYTSGIVMEQGTIASEVICPMYSALCCMLVLFMEFYVLRENRMEREREMMEQMLRVVNDQRRTSQETIDIINMKCHDLKHQIRALADMSDEVTRSAYVAEVQQAVSIYDADYHTGCEALDYILREKTLLANDRHITFSCMADGSAIAFMSPADVYALMGNALDNALERVVREPEERRIISLLIKRTGAMVLIHLENQCGTPPEFQDGFPVTDKSDKTTHGFGVRSIRYLVEKYHGEVLMRAADEKFCLDILMPTEE